jgi:hypothetical protein
VAVVRRLGPHAELRFTVGYDRRTSSEPLITDYEKWDGGVGGTVRWRF